MKLPAQRDSTFTETAAEAARNGWPDVVAVPDFSDEFAEIDAYVAGCKTAHQSNHFDTEAKFKQLTVVSRGPEKLKRLALAAMQGVIWAFCTDERRVFNLYYPGRMVAITLLARKFPPDETYVRTLLKLLDEVPPGKSGYVVELAASIVKTTEHFADAGGAIDDEMKKFLRRTAVVIETCPHKDKKMRQAVDVARSLCGEAAAWPMSAGEAWSDVALADLNKLDAAAQSQWRELLDHAIECNDTRPGNKWLDAARRFIRDGEAPAEPRVRNKSRLGRSLALPPPIDRNVLAEHLERWLTEIGQPGTVAQPVEFRGMSNNTIPPGSSQDLLGGLCWFAALTGHPQALRSLADAAEASFRVIPKLGPRCVRLGNAAVRALASVGTMDAIAQLARLELRVRTPKGRKIVRKFMDEAIEKSGLTRQDVEETTVPDFGLRDGRATIAVADWTAEIAIDGFEPTLVWKKPDGSAAKTVAAIKKIHPGQVESIQRTLKDIESMLPAQRRRLELLLRDTRTWRIDDWRRRYLDHGLLAPMVRRLIWLIDGTPALFVDASPQDVQGNPIEIGQTAEIAIWHPVGRSVDEVVAWRRRLEGLRITQPFKQAHREVYLITDAELATSTYSNRFAAHIVKTQVFIAIGQTRKWTVTLYGQASLELPQFDLRAEYWANQAGDEFSHMGGPRYLSTDQLRFYATSETAARAYKHRGLTTEPLELAHVPILAFSEVMRDCDLFVGISSVGADPTWRDAGSADPRYQRYWHDFSFGDLTESAKTRKAVLDRLVPRLKIAPRCSVTEKFLVVRGDLRKYKIHLGSGNILMEPNDQYLCIVPARGGLAPSGAATGETVFLPFEGDQMLSVILSKAFLLADDKMISDPTITRQIGNEQGVRA